MSGGKIRSGASDGAARAYPPVPPRIAHTRIMRPPLRARFASPCHRIPSPRGSNPLELLNSHRIDHPPRPIQPHTWAHPATPTAHPGPMPGLSSGSPCFCVLPIPAPSSPTEAPPHRPIPAPSRKNHRTLKNPIDCQGGMIHSTPIERRKRPTAPPLRSSKALGPHTYGEEARAGEPPSRTSRLATIGTGEWV